MPQLLIRDLSMNAYRKIRTLAHKENVSLSKEAARLLDESLKQREEKEMGKKEEEEAYQRLLARREEMRNKYGKHEDSSKMIREMREERGKKFL